MTPALFVAIPARMGRWKPGKRDLHAHRNRAKLLRQARKNPAPFDKVRDRNLEDQRSRSPGDQLVPRKELGLQATSSFQINALANPAEATLYHVCVVAFNGRPSLERSYSRWCHR